MKATISSALVLGAAMLVFTTSCKKEDPQLGQPPTAADAAFTYQASATNDNIIEFIDRTNQLKANKLTSKPYTIVVNLNVIIG